MDAPFDLTGRCAFVPGGYGDQNPEAAGGGQFPVQDSRNAAEIAAWLGQSGFDVRFEDDHVRT